MALPKIPIPNIVRTGSFNGNLEESLKRYSENFMKSPPVFPTSEKYFYYQEVPPNYLIFVAHDLPESSRTEPNFYLTIASDNSDYNERILAEFEAKTQIPALSEPESEEVRYYLGLIAVTLPVLKRGGRVHIKNIFDFLRDMP